MNSSIRVVLVLLPTLLGVAGCAVREVAPPAPICPQPAAQVEIKQLELFRRAETERAAQLTAEIERLQADLRTAEEALVEAESGLAGTHTRADAVSSLAATRIQVERAATRAPWRQAEVEDARTRLDKAKAQVDEGHFGAALFFVYRARRVADAILAEAQLVMRHGDARLVRARRVNLRAGPSTEEPILSVLAEGTPVFPQSWEGDWVLVQVSSGPAGWIHRRLVGAPLLATSAGALQP